MHLAFVVVFALVALIPFEKDGKWGYRDDAGRVVISPRYEIAREFSGEGIAAVVDDKGWAYIDEAGRVLGDPSSWTMAPITSTRVWPDSATMGRSGSSIRAGRW